MLPFKIVWLCGLPRSGTNWFSQIFDSHEEVNFKLAPLFSYEFRDRVDANSNKEEWIKLFKEIYESDSDFLNQTQKRLDGVFPTFEIKDAFPDFLVIKETRFHSVTPKLLDYFKDIRIVYIVRNPCGAINSWLSSKKEFPANANPKEEWRTGNCRKTHDEAYWGFDDWMKLTKQYLDLEIRCPKNVKVISYEDMVEQASEKTKEMFTFVGLSFSEETRKFLELSQSTHSEHGNAVYKNKEVKDKWRTHLDPEIVEAIRLEVKGTNLEQYFYK